MKVSVYHNAFGDEFVKVASYVSKKEHHSVALEEAFHLTNTIDSAWYDNQDLEIHRDLRRNGIRTTSVEDFIEIADGKGATKWYRVENFGFKAINLNDVVDYVRYEDNKRIYKTSRLIDMIM